MEGEKQKEKKDLKVVVQLHSGDVLIWQESDQQLCRCVFSMNRAVIVKHIFLNRNELLLVSEYGEGFKGIIKPRKRKRVNQNDKVPKSIEKDALDRLLEKDDCIYVSLQKIPKIHRAIYIQSDIKGKDYCIIQVTHRFLTSSECIFFLLFQAQPFKQLVNAQKDPSEVNFDLKKFLDISVLDDGITDIKFILKDGSCVAHRYILLSRCPNVDNKITKLNEDVIKLPEIDSFVFQQFLTFVYTGDCDFLHAHTIELSFLQSRIDIKKEANHKPKSKDKSQSPMDSLRCVAKQFGCSSLVELLKKTHSVDNSYNSEKQFVLSRFQFKNLYDITLKCIDGEVNAHRCVLSARMEYFGNMLSNRWGGVSKKFFFNIKRNVCYINKKK